MLTRTPARRATRAALLGALVTLAAPLTAVAHEFWMIPSAFHAPQGELIRVELFHGERFAGEAVARNTPMISRYELVLGAEPATVQGMHGSSVGFLRPQASGNGVIVYQSNEYINILPAELFEAYLAEEGLDLISDERAAHSESSQEGREAYVRCAKSLISIGNGPAPAAPVDHPQGLPLEIVLDGTGPTEAGHGVGATLLFEGQPLEGVRVVAVAAAEPHELIELTTDAEGHVAFAADHHGAWMITSLHMVRASERDDVDWNSYWASLTFALPAEVASRHAHD